MKTQDVSGAGADASQVPTEGVDAQNDALGLLFETVMLQQLPTLIEQTTEALEEE